MSDQVDDLQTFLMPGEQIVWRLDIKEGVIHRHPKSSHLITNQRVIVIDRLENRIRVALPIAQTDLVIMNRHSSSSGSGASYGRGVRGFSSSRTSHTVGTLVFTVDGVQRITLGGVSDPQGVKNLFASIKKESAKSQPKRIAATRAVPPPRVPTTPAARVTNAAQVKYCSNCGAELSADSAFCNKCGLTQP